MILFVQLYVSIRGLLINPSIKIAPRYKFQPNSKLIKLLQKLNLDRKQKQEKEFMVRGGGYEITNL